MERKRFSVLFFIKRSKLLKNGEAPVRVHVTYDRLYVELQLKRSIKVPLWSQDKEKSVGKDRNSAEHNLLLLIILRNSIIIIRFQENFAIFVFKLGDLYTNAFYKSYQC